MKRARRGRRLPGDRHFQSRTSAVHDALARRRGPGRAEHVRAGRRRDVRRAGNPHAILGLAWFSSALCVLLLAVGLARLPDLLRDVESASALLLFLPGLLSLYFVRPGEHPIATRIFSGVRVAVVTATMCTLAAGLLVILDIDPGWRQLWWTVLLILASAALLAITVANLSFRSPPVRGDALPSADPPAPPTWSRRHPRVLASALAIAVVTASLMLGMAIVPTTISACRTVSSARSRTRRTASAGDEAELALDAFGGVPWKRMYVFAGGTPRDVVAAELGEDKVVNGEQRGRGLPQSLDDDAQLVALIDDDAVVEASPCTTNRACSNHRASRRTRRAWSCGLPTGHGSTPPGRSRRHRAIAAADRGRLLSVSSPRRPLAAVGVLRTPGRQERTPL